jgi:4-diphosphocytidyl-2-C-methyl-D-erythritol kinase
VEEPVAMKVRTVAPAKINWTLEVLGKRPDGYHEIKSVMQTIDLCDEVEVEKSDRTTLNAKGYQPDDDDLTLCAVRVLEETTRRELPVAIRLVKRIPVAAGLGGGSSDAAAVLRAVDRLYGLGLSRAKLAEVGATVGSDVSFFVYGGTALVEGRGERVTVLPDVGETWVVVVVPAVRIADKTQTMYAGLTAESFTDGARTEEMLLAVRGGKALETFDVHGYNAFERQALRLFPELDWLFGALFTYGLIEFTLTGAGPSMFTFTPKQAKADDVAAYAELLTSDSLGKGGPVAHEFMARTLGGEEATRVWVEA